MADDAAYLSFLEKANEPLPVAAAAKATDPARVALKTVDGELPRVLREVVERDVVFVSEADEAFEGVSLKLEGKGMPDEGTFVGTPMLGVWCGMVADGVYRGIRTSCWIADAGGGED